MKQTKTFTILPFTKEIYQKFFKAGVLKQKNLTEDGLIYKGQLIAVQDNGFDSWITFTDSKLNNQFDKGALKNFRELMNELKTVFYLFQTDYCGYYQYLREHIAEDNWPVYYIGSKKYKFDEIADIVNIDKEIKKLNKLKYCELDKYAIKESHEVKIRKGSFLYK